MKVYYASYINVEMPDGHRFPMEKYDILRHFLFAQHDLFSKTEFVPAKQARREQILKVHTLEYFNSVVSGTLNDKELRRIGLPWSKELIIRTLASVGGTIAACQSAITDGLSVNLGGGTHHAFPDHGEGFCIFNDVAVAARTAQSMHLMERVVIIDCDVHQGNGTAYIFRGDDSVFTFSIHAEKNFPFRKWESNLDIGLPDNTEDGAYLAALKSGLEEVFAKFDPQLCVYIAGADPYLNDRLGKLSLTLDGLAHRDEIVIGNCLKKQIPIAIVMGGGYAKDIRETAAIYAQTVSIAKTMGERDLLSGKRRYPIKKERPKYNEQKRYG